MTTRLRDRLALGSCVAMGLGISTGHPAGMISAAAMPYACLTPATKKDAFRAAFGYYLAALWPMIGGLDRYLGRSGAFLTTLAIWIFGAAALSFPWTLAATANRAQYLWRTPLAVMATVLPPLGIIGLASPLTSAGYLFPGTAWIGLAAVSSLPGLLLAIPALPTRYSRIASWCVFTACIALAIVPRLLGSGDIARPSGWIAVNTNLGDVSQPFRDFAAARLIQDTAAKATARVLIFPESVVPRWSEATEDFWLQSLDRCRRRGQILAFGAGLPRPAQNGFAKLNDLRSYDFGAALNALKRMDGALAHPIASTPSPEPMDNALVITGGESAVFYQRVPVPIGMWEPLNPSSVPLRLRSRGILNIDHQRAAVLICYEQMLTFPVLASMLQHPTVIVGISNTFWVAGTSIPRYQANAVRAWARLFRLPYFLAVNS